MAATPRSIYVAAPDDSLIRALAEHRPPSSGWRFAPLDGVPDPDALVILDLDEDSVQRDRLDEVRAGGFAGPVLILGEAGAARAPEDEPVARPVRLGTLLQRIDAHGAEPEGGGTYLLGPYEFMPRDPVLRRSAGGDPIRLTELERKLLSCLAEAAGATIAREQLLARVWGYSAGAATHTVETHIWRLRQKIETDDPSTHFLLTEAGGYRLALAQSGED